VRADMDRQRVGIHPLPPREHVTHLIEPHGAARGCAPAREERPPLSVLVRQRPAVLPPATPGPIFAISNRLSYSRSASIVSLSSSARKLYRRRQQVFSSEAVRNLWNLKVRTEKM
jgi:hypothetical protein